VLCYHSAPERSLYSLRKLRETLIPTRTITREKTWLRTCGRLKNCRGRCDAGGDARESSAEKSQTVEECAAVGFADQRGGVSGTAAHGGALWQPREYRLP